MSLQANSYSAKVKGKITQNNLFFWVVFSCFIFTVSIFLFFFLTFPFLSIPRFLHFFFFVLLYLVKKKRINVDASFIYISKDVKSGMIIRDAFT